MLTKTQRLEIVKLVEQGFRYYSIANRLGLNFAHCKGFVYTIEVFGKETFLNMAGTKTYYSYETKVAAVKDHLAGLSIRETMIKYGILSPIALSSWIRLYRREGPLALKPKPKGRPKNPSLSMMSREQQLEYRIKELEAENAVLKKVMALKASKH